MRLLPKFAVISLVSVLLTACSSGEAPFDWQNYATLGLYSAAISKDGRYAAIGAQEEGGSLWEIETQERLYEWNHQKNTRSLIAKTAFSPENEFAVTANQQDLVLWHTKTGKPEWFWSSPGEILAIALAPKGRYALLGLANHTAVFFDIVNGGIKRTFRHGGRVRSVALSRDGQTAITGADDFTTSVWDVESGKLLQKLTLENIVDTVAISDDGKTVFSASSLDKGVVWDVASGEVISYISGNESFMQKRISYLSSRFSNDGAELLTGSSSGSVQLWDSQNGEMLRDWQAHKKDLYGPNSVSVIAVAFADSGDYLALGSNGVLNEFR
ncbi:MAG: WD40 repeat protein [Oceanospirillaceae bacterium]|jgi:WD40 repeat protein